MKTALLVLATALVLSAQQPTRLLGTITGNDGKAIKVKSDQGAESLVLPMPEARIQKVAPGERDLTKAQPITLADLQPGDRIIVRGSTAGGGILADSLIIMTARDISEKNDAERQMWRDRGVFGIVESVDAKDRRIKLRTRVGMETKTLTITAAPEAGIKRYAPDSVKFTDAVAGRLEDIKKGDQLRALGDKDEANARLSAGRIVFGTFRTFAGTITSIDAAARILQLAEAGSKKVLTIHATADSTLKTMPAFVRMGHSGGGPGIQRPGRFGGPGGGMHPGGGPPDIAMMIERLPAIGFENLRIGDTVIVASTLGARQDDFTAITLLAGAQPILDMLAANQQAAQARSGAGPSIGGPGGMGGDDGLSGLGIGMMP